MNKSIVEKLALFLKEEKFLIDSAVFYPGLQDEKLRQLLTKLINQAIADFIEAAETNSDIENYQNKIKLGLSRFEFYRDQFDSEDEDRICYYFESMMDIVGIESSGGHLNKWRYGFDIS